MTLNSTLDVLYLVLAISAGWIAIFICWMLYEIAKLLHQANALVTDTREKISRLEHAVMAVKEKLESSATYLGAIAEGGKSLLSFLHTKEEKKEQRRRTRKKKSDEDDEDEE